ncbi:copper chaperone PCu(A)C [uncultured Shewanella sp.]|uniref:copper chaperone PCu(A)C n=1 Tax=uncultured Shewanella sp. TaxID=173975 RepID=UPI002637DDE7|nr:copper chaperone PCu(A)C [uncultured Shewanella sp.]
MRNIIFSVLIVVCGLAQGSELMISSAWIRAMPMTSRVVPIYLTIDNPTSEQQKLISITAMRGEVEIHQTLKHHGVMSMSPVDEIIIAPHSQVKLAPGGFHGMMSHFNQGVPALGDKVALILTFSNGEKQQIEATVNKQLSVSSAHKAHSMTP